MATKLLATFVANDEKFHIYGEYEVKTSKTMDLLTKQWIDFRYPDFFEVTAKRVVGMKEEDYSPNTATWIGEKYTAIDMIEGFIAARTMGNEKDYTSIYLETGLQEIVDDYTDCIGNIPKRILKEYSMYQLIMLTDRYIYYTHEDTMLMLNTDTHQIVSDNYFAEVGYWDSVENIQNRKEKLIWGELPEE